ncbi:hypothetical protein CQW23_21575 [Capsicum baccatum]|uniref:Uncharacterized protein n=1 Tax=Capsicum baccatum TaxID=33114 RepID=A0A2G2VYE7_CAPBA|nr:hypothetical protein CQW23_21575 [Capsicum baccatum]
MSKPESHVEKEAFISKKVFDAFRNEVRQEFKEIRKLVKKKFKKMLKKIEQSKQQHEDKDPEVQQMDYASAETSPQRFNPTVVQNLGENQDDKTNIEIDSQHLIPDELLQSINLDYNLSEKIVHHDGRITDEKMDEINLSDLQFIIPDELLPSLNAYQRESITTHPSATHEEEPSDEHFNDKKSEFVVQVHCQQIDVFFYYLRKNSKYDPNRSYKFSTVDCNFMNIFRSIHDIYSVDDPNLAAERREAHLNEYINGFRMDATVPWHILENIYIRSI